MPDTSLSGGLLRTQDAPASNVGAANAFHATAHHAANNGAARLE